MVAASSIGGATLPVYEYVCPDKHETTRVVSLAKAPGSKTITCLTWVGRPKRVCMKKATRRTVYAVHVNGGPTRGAF